MCPSLVRRVKRLTRLAQVAVQEWVCDLPHHLRLSGPARAMVFSAHASSSLATQLLNRPRVPTASVVSADPAGRPVPRQGTLRNSRLPKTLGGCRDCGQTGRNKLRRPPGAGLVVAVTSRKQSLHSRRLVSLRLPPGSCYMPDTNSYLFSYDLLRLSRSSPSKHLAAVSVVHRLADLHISQLILAVDISLPRQSCGLHFCQAWFCSILMHLRLVASSVTHGGCMCTANIL